MVTGVAKTIMTHFKKHPLAIVNVKGRAKGTSVQELVFQLEVCTPMFLFFFFVYILINQIGLKFSSVSCLFLSLSLSKQQVQFLSLRSLAKSYFTGVGGQEINLCIRKRSMLVLLGKRVGLGQLSLLNSWLQSDWNVGCRVATRKRQLYSLELKLVSIP